MPSAAEPVPCVRGIFLPCENGPWVAHQGRRLETVRLVLVLSALGSSGYARAPTVPYSLPRLGAPILRHAWSVQP